MKSSTVIPGSSVRGILRDAIGQYLLGAGSVIDPLPLTGGGGSDVFVFGDSKALRSDVIAMFGDMELVLLEDVALDAPATVSTTFLEASPHDTAPARSTATEYSTRG